MDSFIWIARCKKTNAIHSNVKHHLSHWQSVAIFHKFHSGWHYANRVCQHLINFDGKKIKFSMSMISSISEAQWAGQLIISWESCLGWAGAGSRWLGWLWCLMGGRWKDLTPGPAPPSLCPHPALIHPQPSQLTSFRLRLGSPGHCLWKQRRFKWRQQTSQGPATLTAPRTVSPSQLFGKLDLFTWSKLPWLDPL